MTRPTIPLFSYGTLQQREVQLANYGRLLDGEPDALPGFKLSAIAIGDPEVLRVSRQAVHLIARPTGEPEDRVEGVVFRLTPYELAATDAYEGDNYVRVEVELASGRRAFVYVAPQPAVAG